jgi:SAM-dependent methyltransferase
VLANALARDAQSRAAVSTPDTYSDWDVYRFGLLVGARALPVAPRHAVKRLVLPVEYIRCSEFRYVLEHLDVTGDHRVLDIGSPKLLSLFLASRVGANIWATDLVDDFFPPYAAYAASVLGSKRQRYVIETQDARTLTYRDESFDRVFSVSVVEHIPGDGDARAIQEIARVLKPGGIACLTVPWSDRGYLEEFHAAGPDVYWVRSSDREKVFYQRAYDRASLQARLLEHDRLELVDLSFRGERRIAVEDAILNPRLPRFVRYAMLPAHFALNRLFLSELGETERSCKKVACLTLRKRSA